MQQPEQPLLKSCLGDSQQIGYAGGTISVGNYTLVIPEGALLQTTKITVEQEVCGDWPVRLSPDGTQFAVPVTLQMDASSESDPGSMNVKWWNPSTSQWVPLGSAHSGSTVSASLSHFSRYTLG